MAAILRDPALQEAFDREKADLERRLAAAAADEAERKKLEAEIKSSSKRNERELAEAREKQAQAERAAEVPHTWCVVCGVRSG